MQAQTYLTMRNEQFDETCYNLQATIKDMKELRMRTKKTVTFANGESSKRYSVDESKSTLCEIHGINGCHYCRNSVPGENSRSPSSRRINRGLELDEVMDTMRNIVTEMEHLKRQREHDRQRIEMEKNNALDNIKHFRRRIVRIIDSLDEKATKETLARFERMANKIQTDIKTCESYIKRVDNLDNGKHISDIGFVEYIGQKQKWNEGHWLNEELAALAGVESIELKMDEEVEEYMKSIKAIGKFIDNQPKPYKPGTKLSRVFKAFKATSSEEHGVKLKNDRAQCNVLGSCVLPEGRMLLADNRNNKLKCLDYNLTVVDECALPGQPWAVCCISESEAAVAMGTSQCIQLVSYDRYGHIKPTKVLDLEDECFGIAYSQGEYFVTSHHVVHVYDKNGRHLRKFDKDNHGNDIFFGTYDISLSPDGSKVYVADCKRDLVILNRQGEILSVYSDPEMKDAWGVCTDYRGNVFVGGYWSHNIVQLTPEGKKVAVVLDKLNGLKNPKSVCFDAYRSKLIVAKDSDSILAFDLK